MNLIEQLGGYEATKEKYQALSDSDMITIGPVEFSAKDYFEDELLEYRRQHNIFEVGDLITHPVFWGLFQVKETMKHHVLGVTSTGYESKLAMELIRHAEPEEIKAGKRLEVKCDS